MDAVRSLACMLLVYVIDWHTATVIKVQTSFSLIFAQKECQVKANKISNATPGLGAMHAICPAMLGSLAFDEKKDVRKKTSISLWPLIASCMQLLTATVASTEEPMMNSARTNINF